MSASSKKKIRKEQNAEQLTQRQQQEQKEAKKLRLTTTLFIAGLALILVAFIGISVYNTVVSSGVIGKWTTVATVGEHKISLTDFNYYYVDAVTEVSSEWSSTAETYTQYGLTSEEAIAMITGGLDITKPMTELIYDETTGQTWADYMVEEALANAQRDYILYDAAMAAGFKLSEEDQAELDSIPETLELYATWTSYGSAKAFIREAYGYGKYATVESYVEYVERGMIADAYYEQYSADLTYDDAALRAYEGDTPENYNSYTYAYYTVNVSDFLEGGTTTYSEDEKEAARAQAEATANDLIDVDSLDAFNDKIAHTFSPELVDHTHDEEGNEIPIAEETAEETTTEETTEETAEEVTDETTEEVTEEVTEEETEEVTEEPETSITTYDTLHSSSKSEFREWMAKAETVTGSATILPIETTTDNEDGTSTTEITGYYAVYMVKKSDNTKAPVSVRHLLVQVEEEATEEEWAAAKAEAEQLLADWKAGEATEDSFHTLVHDNTDDTASAETGGLYEDIHETSSYVDNFLAWCVDDARTEGETGIVETEYGYHIMYFVGRDDMSYRDQMISDELRAEDTQTWITDLVAKTPLTKKNLKKIDKDMVSLQY